MKNFSILTTMLIIALGPVSTANAPPATVTERLEQIEERIASAEHLKEAFPQLIDGKLITLLVFKDQQEIEFWKETARGQQLIKRYPLTATSGGPGPKLQEGDLQIPEGIYSLPLLNPNSQFHLSFKLIYPNEFDIAKAKADKRIPDAPSPEELASLGGDIYVHGKALSVGCLAVGDTAIEELFYLVAKNGLSNTKVIIAPCDLRKYAPPKLETPIEWYGELCLELAEALSAYPFSPGTEDPNTPEG